MTTSPMYADAAATTAAALGEAGAQYGFTPKTLPVAELPSWATRFTTNPRFPYVWHCTTLVDHEDRRLECGAGSVAATPGQAEQAALIHIGEHHTGQTPGA